jgi:tRNA threonylcarbamoyl adenosine modification protein (Sua5/YciO/YrdC/YwlC family)
MIEYVVEQNPDDRVLQRASNILTQGGLVCLPTETNWVVCACTSQRKSIDKLYELRHVDNTKHFTVLCDSFQKAMEIAFISDSAFKLVKKVTPGSFVFIFEAQKAITKMLKASKTDHQVGIRFPPSHLVRKLLEVHGKPILSTHLTHDMFEEADPEIPLYSAQIEDQFGNLLDIIIDPGEYEFLGVSTIVDFTSGEPHVLRVGLGDPRIFS